MFAGAVYLFDEAFSAAPTNYPTATPQLKWFLDQTYGSDIPGSTGSQYGQSVSMYTNVILVGAPSTEIGGVAMGSVSVLDAYSSTALLDVSYVQTDVASACCKCV